MSLLGCSEEEALQVIEDDKRIDKGEDLFPLTEEQKAVEKKMKNTDTKTKKPTVYNFNTRERKADTTKEGVIEQIYNFLCENGYENVEILNKSKLIAFKIGEDSYEFDLKRKRKPKNS